jgi:hemerythrin-like domain-containing protein
MSTADHLRTDHLEFGARFADVCGRARTDDWRDLDDVWGAFAKALREHLAFEERELFEDYAAEDAGCRALVDRLREEHDQIRRDLDALGIEIQLKCVRATTIDAFVALMKRHAEAENAQLYPWAQAREFG